VSRELQHLTNKSSAIVEMAAQCCTSQMFAVVWGYLSLSLSFSVISEKVPSIIHSPQPCTVSKILWVTGKIFSVDRGCLSLMYTLGVNPKFRLPNLASTDYKHPSIAWYEVSLVRCGRPHRSFCQFRCTTWTLLLVVSLLLLQDSGTRFL